MNRALVIQTAFIGDVLLCIPLLKILRQHFDHVSFVCRPGLGEILLRYGIIDRAYEVDKRDASQWRRLQEELTAQDFDFVISPHQSFRTALLVRKLRSKRKVGFKNWWNYFFYSDRVNRPLQLPDALRQLSLMIPLKPDFKEKIENAFSSEIPDWASMTLTPLRSPLSEGGMTSLDLVKALERRFGIEGPYIGLAPGSQWETKRWLPERFVEVGQHYASKNYTPLIFGAAAEAPLCASIAKQVPSSCDLSGKLSLLESMELMRSTKLLFTNDSGAMHLASVAGVPSVAVFGPTVPAQGYRPWHPMARVVEVELGCRPCGAHGSRRCPIGTHDCMKKVLAKDVIAAGNEIVN